MCLFFAVRMVGANTGFAITMVGANTGFAPTVGLGFNKHFPVLEIQFSTLGLTLYGLDVALMRVKQA